MDINKTSRCNVVHMFLTSSENHKNHQKPTFFTRFSCLGLISSSLILSRQMTSHERQTASRDVKSREMNVKKRQLTSGGVRKRRVAAQWTSKGHEVDLQTTSWDIKNPAKCTGKPVRGTKIPRRLLIKQMSDSVRLSDKPVKTYHERS